MTLYKKIQEDWKIAFKARDTIKKDILNFVKSQLQNKAIELGKDPSDKEVIAVIKKEIKTRKESIVFLEKQNDNDSIVLERQNISYLEVYLPETMSQEQTHAVVLGTIEMLGITDLKKQRGQLMGAIMNQYGSTIDGAILNQVVTSMLS